MISLDNFYSEQNISIPRTILPKRKTQAQTDTYLTSLCRNESCKVKRVEVDPTEPEACISNMHFNWNPSEGEGERPVFMTLTVHTKVTRKYKDEYVPFNLIDPFSQYKYCVKMFREMELPKKDFKFIFFPEFTNDNCIHWHGIVQGSKFRKGKFVGEYKRLFEGSFIRNDGPPRDISNVKAYCTKSVSELIDEEPELLPLTYSV